MVKEDIETVIDKLYDLIKAGNKVTVKEAARALSLTEEQVEKLAMILEESDLIEVQYTLGGSVLMPKKTELQKPLIPVAETKPSEPEVLENIRSVENVAEFIEKDFIERLSKAEKALSAAAARKDLKKSDIELIRRELSFLQGRLKTFQENVKKIEVGEVSFEQQISKFQTQLEELEKTSKGDKKGALAFLAHFLAFLLAWLHSLSPSAKKTQQKPLVVKPPAPKAQVAEKPGEGKPAPHHILPSLPKITLPNLVAKPSKAKPAARSSAKAKQMRAVRKTAQSKRPRKTAVRAKPKARQKHASAAKKNVKGKKKGGRK